MDIVKIAEKLLRRNLTAEDGITEAKINDELPEGVCLPDILFAFYKKLGNCKTVLDTHNHFGPINELLLIDTKLVFLEENQGVCYWAVDIENLLIYQTESLSDPEWYDENIEFSQFIEFIVYYQFAQGGYEGEPVEIEFLEKSGALDIILKDLSKHWELCVDFSSTMIYYNDGKLIWYFSDENKQPMEIIYFCACSEDELDDLMDQYME